MGLRRWWIRLPMQRFGLRMRHLWLPRSGLRLLRAEFGSSNPWTRSGGRCFELPHLGMRSRKLRSWLRSLMILNHQRMELQCHHGAAPLRIRISNPKHQRAKLMNLSRPQGQPLATRKQEPSAFPERECNTGKCPMRTGGRQQRGK